MVNFVQIIVGTIIVGTICSPRKKNSMFDISGAIRFLILA